MEMPYFPSGNAKRCVLRARWFCRHVCISYNAWLFAWIQVMIMYIFKCISRTQAWNKNQLLSMSKCKMNCKILEHRNQNFKNNRYISPVTSLQALLDRNRVYLCLFDVIQYQYATTAAQYFRVQSWFWFVMIAF